MRTLVTGGGGFLGRRIVELLVAEGHAVRVVARNRYPELEAIGADGVECDIRDLAALDAAIDEVDVVFHAAACVGYWGDRREYWSTNVEGTRNVLSAARRAGVHRLVYTSTPSVLGYARDIENGPADLAYAREHQAIYPETKAVAEQAVLEANGQGLRTVALRPHLIIGPGDEQLMPRFVRRARSGRLRIVGDGRNLVDLTYVDNAAWAHLDAAVALNEPESRCAGKAYCISNAEPVPFWPWLNEVLDGLGIPPVTKSISLERAQLIGKVAEAAWRALPLRGKPPITAFLANGLARSHWYDQGPARADLGYTVRVPMREATRETIDWLARTVMSAKS